MTRRGRRRLFHKRRGRHDPQVAITRLWSALQSSARELRLPPRTLRLLATLGGGAIVLSSLGIVAFRTEILRARYELGDLVAQETRLSEERAALRVAVRRLRDPERLERLARERGFGPPERVLELAAAGEDGP
jgi:cell division protein FtsL